MWIYIHLYICGYTYMYVIKMTVIGSDTHAIQGYIYTYIYIYIYMGYTRRTNVPHGVGVNSNGVTRCQLTSQTQRGERG